MVEAPPSAEAVAVPPVIDVEASGFGRGSYPIEVGFVLPDGHSDCMLIRPLPDWRHWDPAAERLHRISRDALVAFGRPVDDVAARLNRALDGLTVYCDGWGNDFTWLSKLYDAAGRRPTFRLESIATLLSEDALGRWERVKASVFDGAAQVRHRASADARLLQTTIARVQHATA